MKRFWDKVQKTKKDKCWIWLACKDKNGYGQFYLNGKSEKSHRVSYMLANRCSILKNFNILHKCDNPCCVNPKHLFLGTQKDNVKDMIHKGRRSDTKGNANGHAKINDQDVIEIKRLFHEDKLNQTQISQLYPINNRMISRIITGQAWSHIKDKYYKKYR